MNYGELAKLKEQWGGKVCLFGAGLIGSTWAYDILKAMEIQVDFYCDNGKEEGVRIREEVKTISLDKLYSLKNDVLVFITVTYKHQNSIKEQLEENGIHNIIGADYLCLQTFIEDLLARNDRKLYEKFRCILDDKEYISRQFEYHIGYRPNLEKPQTFNEKMQWLKLYDRNPEYITMVDKYEAKKYIADKIGEEFIIPTLGIYNSFEEINFTKLPNQFVLKCTHDSGSVVICKNKKDLNKVEAKYILERGLKRNFYWVGREWPYKNIKPRIIVEEYLEDGEEFIDYKFLCMRGKVKISFTCSNRFQPGGLCVNFYDREWNPLPFERHYPRRKKEIEKPEKYEDMVRIAENLSAGLIFVRIDFYMIENQIRVGEITFYPGNGMEEFTPAVWDYRLGEMLRI